jgi:hypothetical protein
VTTTIYIAAAAKPAKKEDGPKKKAAMKDETPGRTRKESCARRLSVACSQNC